MKQNNFPKATEFGKSKPTARPKVKAKPQLIKESAQQFPLTRINFIIMGVAALLIVVGFLLMLGSGSTTEHFNPDIFSTRRIIVGPTIAFIGFVAMAVGIIKRPKTAAE